MVKEEDIQLMPDGTARWTINEVGDIGGTYTGTFTFRTALDPIQEIYADREYRDLLGKNMELVNSHIENLATILATLKYRIVEAPPFWNNGGTYGGGHIKDKNILFEIYSAAILAETKYRKTLAEKHKESIDKLKKTVERLEEERQVDEELEEDDEGDGE